MRVAIVKLNQTQCDMLVSGKPLTINLPKDAERLTLTVASDVKFNKIMEDILGTSSDIFGGLGRRKR